MTLAPTDVETRFDRTIDRWFRDQLALSPEVATFLGLHDHDGDLAPGGRDAVDEYVAFHRRAIDELSAIDHTELSQERALDRDLAIHQAHLALYWATEYRPWAGSSGAAEHIGESLFPLFTRDFAPLAERLESIVSRLEKAPTYIAETHDRVTDPVRLWTEIDLESTEHLPSFLDTIVAAARAEAADERLADRLASASDATKVALEEHAAWLRDDVLPRASADWTAGPERFEEMVRLRELEADGDEILAVGEELLVTEKAARDALGSEIEPGASVEQVADAVKDDHAATFAEALEEYRATMARSRAFVVERGLATPPEEDHLNVIETPSFIRHLIPFAAYYSPAKFDPTPVGTYIVTPPSSPEMMREHNRASISNTSVHEAYPGHHLQLSAAVTNPSLVRLFSGAPEFAEGWAFYCERMMKEAGFDDSPKGWYIVHTDAIWRATRIILDVQLHRGLIGFDEAVDRLVAETGFERPAALAEVKRYTSTPTYQLSYLFGRHMIEKLKADVQAPAGRRFRPAAIPRHAALRRDDAGVVCASPLRGERPMNARRARIGLAAGLVLVLAACGGGANAVTETGLPDRAPDSRLRPGDARGCGARHGRRQRRRRGRVRLRAVWRRRAPRDRELRRPRAMRLLRRHLVPSHPGRIRDPGRRSGNQGPDRAVRGRRPGRTGLSIRDRASGGRTRLRSVLGLDGQCGTGGPRLQRQPVLRGPDRSERRPAARVHDLRPGRRPAPMSSTPSPHSPSTTRRPAFRSSSR